MLGPEQVLGLILVTAAIVWLLLAVVAVAMAVFPDDPEHYQPPRYTWRF
jgi:hypothetical protein